MQIHDMRILPQNGISPFKASTTFKSVSVAHAATETDVKQKAKHSRSRRRKQSSTHEQVKSRGRAAVSECEHPSGHSGLGEGSVLCGTRKEMPSTQKPCSSSTKKAQGIQGMRG
eukprot:6189124-Pleurochrysis_carterae.AAC.2